MKRFKMSIGFDWIAKGFKGIADGMASINLFPKKRYFTMEDDGFKRDKEAFKEDREALMSDWKKICPF